MKKTYLFVSSFFVLGTIITLVFFWSYRVYEQDAQKTAAGEKTETVDTVQEIQVNSSMKYIVEVYDGITGITTTEENPVPEEIAGLTRSGLESYISDYNTMVEANGVSDGPDSKELVSFSKDRVVIREVYSGAEAEEGFYLKIENGEVVIFHNDQTTPYEYTGILEDAIRADEREKLTAGYFVADEKELYSILENLSS